MFENRKTIFIKIANEEIQLAIFGESSNQETIFEIDNAEATANGEACIQIKEGCFYEYKISNGFFLKTSEVVSQSKVNHSSGKITPNIYVGTLSIDILNRLNEKCGLLELEVQSVKARYRYDYRHMLEEITEKCTDLLLQYSSPVSQHFEVDFSVKGSTLYQKFAFIKAILDSAEFNDSIHKIILSPVTGWKESQVSKDIRSIKRVSNSTLKLLTSASNRIDLPKGHPLMSNMHSIPSKIRVNYKNETVDIAENRFVKHALISFQSFCNDFTAKLHYNTRVKREAGFLVDKLEQLLSHSIFKEVSVLTTFPLNSPVLQRKEGYREVLRAWLMFDLAARLVWHGGDDVYSGNKKDVAILYEYWVFFKLLEILQEIFKIEPKSIRELIKETKDGIGLQLRQGKHLPLEGIYYSETRNLNVEFSYNRPFSGNKIYPSGGSWTKSMRPDYTLSIWPVGILQSEAEVEESIVHIHFDAKYKVDKLAEIFGIPQNNEQAEDEIQKELSLEKAEQNAGNFKRTDLLKMHSYKDAIRRTAGAYVLYPGNQTELSYTKQGFHELIPGLGAFAIKPSKTNNGTEELKTFLNEVVAHFMDRATQRENMSLKTYETYRFNNLNNLKGVFKIPEAHGSNRNLIPNETFILVAYYKKKAWNWIINSGLYNARAESSRGSLRLGPGETGAKYLLLHSENETKATKLLKITETGPRVFSKKTLISKGYPYKPSRSYYLVYKVEQIRDEEFTNKAWDITKLEGYKHGIGSALPFSVTLTELMNVLVYK
jgi:predicted component of viral defense system (DUF524 family)